MNAKLLSDRLLAAKKAKELRDGVRVTWVAMADACQVSPAAVSRWKADENGIDGKYARPLAAFLGVDAYWLETGNGEMLAGVAPQIDDETQFVINMMLRSDNEGRIMAKNAVIDALNDHHRRHADMKQLNSSTSANKLKTA